MSVRFKLKALESSVHLMAGDRLSLTYTEELGYDKRERLLHSEEVTKVRIVRCFAVLDLPVGMGIVLGEDMNSLREFLNETWPGCEVPHDVGIL